MRLLLAVLLLLLPQSLLAQSSPGSCALDRATNRYLSEGPTDTQLHPPATGEFRVAVLFVDFPDAPASEDARAIYDSFMPGAVAWFQTASNGRFSFVPVPAFKWYRMPLPSTSYGHDTYDRHRKYVQDAVAAANAEVDFTGVKAVYVVQPREASFAISPTLLGYPGGGFVADGVEIRLAVTFGRDTRISSTYGTNVAVHETLHILGLPDLYAYGATTFASAHRFAGAWDMMGWIGPGSHLFAWHTRKLGWIDASQVLCAESGITTATLVPPTTPGGVKAIAARINASKVLVVENRMRTGLDSPRCEEGVLVYTVDATVATGAGPVLVAAASADVDPGRIGTCGIKYAAPFAIGPGRIPSYTDPSGIRVDVLGTSAAGAEVRVAYPAGRRRGVRSR